jgi:CTP:molybdopterin cytidylyltransferase MocA
MGRFKPLLAFGDRTVVEHMIQSFGLAGVESIVVVVGHRSEEMRKALLDQDVILTTNEHPEGPMAESVKLGVAAIPRSARAILLTPVDHAAVSPETISTLIGHWRSGARLVIPTWQGHGGHPVLIDGDFRIELLGLDPVGGLRLFFKNHESEVSRLPVTNPYVVRDMDTWEDYVQLHEDFFGFRPRTNG